MLPSVAVSGGATAGVPIAVIAVWYVNTHLLPAPMPDHVSTAAGALIVSLVSYAAQVLEVLLSKLKEG